MSYECGNHGWRHLLNPCPTCQRETTTYIYSTGTSLTDALIGISKRALDAKEAEIANLSAKLKIAIDALEDCTSGDLYSGEGIYKAEVAKEALQKINGAEK